MPESETATAATTWMEHPFPKSTPMVEKVKRLQEIVNPEDSLAILINADPDAMSAAMALKRFFWRKARKIRVFHVNAIQRPDNLAMVKLLKIDQRHIRRLKVSEFTRWAIVDSQPHHHEAFGTRNFDIIIDHHLHCEGCKARFMDIREAYGATATMMTEYLRAAKIKPSPRLATALFYGIKNDTANFIRDSLPNDLNAFRYLYPFANLNIVKKIESSEMTKKILSSYKMALDKVIITNNKAYVHMGTVSNPDTLVIIADFFMRLAEVTWSFASGIYQDKVIVILRNAGFRADAGKTAQRVFGHLGASAGGHRSAARAEIPLEHIVKEAKGVKQVERFILKLLKGSK